MEQTSSVLDLTPGRTERYCSRGIGNLAATGTCVCDAVLSMLITKVSLSGCLSTFGW